jgi:EmrB/QacA subfamily drug resistance transporter
MGVGAALLLPASLAIVATTFRGKERSAAIAIWISIAWGAQAFGPLVGGVLTELGEWRLIFWINLPLGLIAIALARWACRESRDELADPRIDWPGFATISLGLVALMLALTEANTLGAGSPVIVGLLIASALLLGAFIIIERRAESPIVDLGFFRSRDFIGGNWANFAANFVFGAVLFFMALYLQEGLRFSPLDAGVLLLPATVVMLAFAPVGRLWSDRAGPRWPTVIGLTLVTVGTWTITLVTVSSQYLDLLPGFVILGAGIGLIITPITTATLNAVPASSSGSASGVFNAGSMLGGSFGVAASVALFQSAGFSRLQDLVSAASIEISSKRIEDLESLLISSGSAQSVLGPLTDKVAAEVTTIIRETFVFALSETIFLSVVLAASGAVMAFVLIRGRIHPQALEVVTGERPARTGADRRAGP